MAIGRFFFEEECRKEGKLCEWTFERIREACEKVAMDDIARLGTAPALCGGSSRQSTEWEGVVLSYVCPHCKCFPMDDYIGGYRRDTETATEAEFQ